MKIKKLTDRLGNTFTPLTHKDSVVDKNGVPLKNWIAPIAVQGVTQDYSSRTDFKVKDANHIGLEVKRVAENGSYYNELTVTHDNTTTVNTAKATVYLLGSTGPTGNQSVLTTSSYQDDGGVTHTGLTFDPATNTLKVPKINSELVGGAKGSLVYQEDTDVTTMLPIGSADQILTVKDGVPSWVNKTAGVTGHIWNNGTTEGPVLELIRENMDNLVLNPVPSASGTTSGIVTTATQSFSGDKTFNDNIVVEGDMTVKGDLIAIETKEVEVADKLITLSISESASVDTGNNSGIEVTTVYDATTTVREDRYRGPNFIWNKENGWTTGNTDPSVRSRDINIGDANGALRFNGTSVLTATQYTGNAKTADKVNHAVTFSTGKSFDGSADVSITQNDITGTLNVEHGGTGNSSLVADTIYLGNGTNSIKPLSNGTQYQAIAIGAAGIPEYTTLTLNHVPSVAFTLYEDTTLADVEDFTI